MQVQWGVAPGAPVQGLIGIAVARARSGGSVMSTDVRFFGGIDWASETHQVCLVAADGKIIGERAFAHGGAGLAEMCDWLVTTSGEEPPKIAVAIEVPHGPIVEILLERRFQVDAVNPKQLDRFRDRFTVAGAKDDRRDAYVLGDALRTDRHCFRRLAVEDPVVIELREWSRMAEDLSQERNRLANRVREQLWRYYPQALELGDDPAADWFLDLWVLAPTPAKAVRLRESRVTSLRKAHRIRRLEAAEVLRILRQKPLVVASDVGRIVLATLLGEAAEPLRKRDYHALRTLSGVAPVTRRSGKRCVVLMRQACHLRLRTAVYHWARVAIQHDARSRARYAELRKRGHSHGRALRSVADRLLAVACAMLKAQTPFNPKYTLEAAAA